jgi:hypothetical protein
MTPGGADWRVFMRRHKTAIAGFVVAAVAVFGGAILVFLWFVGNAQSTGMVPSALGQWTMANLVTFILYAIFWEILLIGIPVAVIGIAAWQWWKRLPSEEMRGFDFGKSSRSTKGGSGVSFLFFIAFCIKVYVDGKWNAPICSFSVDYVVGSMITILVWTLVIFGIPAVIALVWWLKRVMKKPPL